MTRTFSRYAVSIVLVAVAAIALWGISSSMYAQQGAAGNEHADTNALAQDPATKLPESDPYAVPSPSPEELIQSLRRREVARQGLQNRLYYLKRQKASEVVVALRKMYPHLQFAADEMENRIGLVGGSSAMHARLNEFLKYSELSPEEKVKRGLPESIREFIQSEAPEMLTGEATLSTTLRQNKSGAASQSLEQQVRQEFDSRQESLRQQIKDFSQRLDKLRVLVDERDRAKDAIIQRRVDELRNPNLRWEAADQAASGSKSSEQPDANVEAKTKLQVVTFRLGRTRPDAIATALSNDFQSKAGIQLSLDQANNSIKIAAIPEEMDQIYALIRKLDAAPADDAAAPASEIDGLWKLAVPPELADSVPNENQTLIVFYKNVYATFTGETLRTAGTFSITPEASPKRIALHGDSPMRGIYDSNEGGLRLSLAKTDSVYPTRFGTEKPEFKRISRDIPEKLWDAIMQRLQGKRSAEAPHDGSSGRGATNPQQDAKKTIEMALLEKIDANFEARPLREVLDQIRLISKVNVVVDDVALRNVAVSPDYPLTVKLKQPIEIKSFLNQILSPLRLRYVVEGDILLITSEAGKGAPASTQPNAPVELPDPAAIDALLIRSRNDLQSDLAWARSNALRTQKAMDRLLAELKKTKPDANEKDIEKDHSAIFDAWHGAVQRLELLRDQMVSEYAMIMAQLKACTKDLDKENAQLYRLVHGLVAEGDVLEQRKLVKQLSIRREQLAQLGNFYESLNDSGKTFEVYDRPQPAANEVEDDLRQRIGINAQSTTFKPSNEEDERKGLLVTAVGVDSQAAKAGIRANDIIAAAHTWETASLGNLWYALSQVYTRRSDDTLENIKIWVWRDGQFTSLHLPPLPLENRNR